MVVFAMYTTLDWFNDPYCDLVKPCVREKYKDDAFSGFKTNISLFQVSVDEVWARYNSNSNTCAELQTSKIIVNQPLFMTSSQVVAESKRARTEASLQFRPAGEL